MKGNRVMASALVLAGGGCLASDEPRVAPAASELSTLYSFRGKIQQFEDVGFFYAISPGNECNFDYMNRSPDFTGPSVSCTGLGQYEYNALSNPADLSTCASYTASTASYACGDPLEGSWISDICNVAVTREPRAHAVGAPAFVVRAINYQVPGNRSSISYMAGDSNGSTWETKTSAGVTLKAEWTLASTSGQLKLQHDTSTKLSLQRSSSLTENLTFTADVADHNRDVVSLWVNPKVDRYDACSGQQELMQFGVATQPWVNPAFDPTQPVMMDFTVGELLHPATVVDTYRSLFLSRLTQDDIRTRILVLDPFVDQATWTVVANPVLNSDRFRPVQGGTCPRNLSDPVTANRSITCQAKYSQGLDTSETFKADWSVSTKLKVEGFSAEREYAVSYSRTTTGSSKNENTAEIKLATSTPGTCISGQLAVDTMFNVYIVSSSVFPCATLQ